MTGDETCDYLMFSFSPVTSFTCTVSVADRQIIFEGAVTSDSYLSDVALSISNVVNPSPAIVTSPFLVYIGSDISANDPFSAVSLSPGTLTSISLTFDPSTVNTTSDLHIKVIPTN